MKRKLYELTGSDDLRFSPYCWRTRMALAHKGLDAEFVPVRFTDKQTIAFSGQDRVPVLTEDGTTVADSWKIACFLEDRYRDRPSLFGCAEGRALCHFINAWTDSQLNATLLRIVAKDILDHLADEDREYFRKTREARLGATLEALHQQREAEVSRLHSLLTPLRTILTLRDFITGAAPAYADYIVFGTFQWVRLVGTIDVLRNDEPLRRWRERMLDLFDAMGRKFPAAARE